MSSIYTCACNNCGSRGVVSVLTFYGHAVLLCKLWSLAEPGEHVIYSLYIVLCVDVQGAVIKHGNLCYPLLVCMMKKIFSGVSMSGAHPHG